MSNSKPLAGCPGWSTEVEAPQKPIAPPKDVTTNQDDFNAAAFLKKESDAFEARVLATHTPAPKNSSQEEAFNSCVGKGPQTNTFGE